ncbi:hypothetical protein [Teichococcus aestuarii]|uniref:hypothetical protein n=1 Tax=Teichococcus aestuarii TaxID=568898 RepID=UPI00361600CC
MAEKPKTFVIHGEDGKKAGEQTPAPQFTPVLVGGQRATLAEDKPKSEPKPAADAKG